MSDLLDNPDISYITRFYDDSPDYPPDQALFHCCRSGAGPGVIAFLISRFPHLARERDSEGHLPIHHAMRKGPVVHMAPLEDLQALLEAYPESLLERTTFQVDINQPAGTVIPTTTSPLMSVLRFPYGKTVIDFFFSRFPPTQTHLDIGLWGERGHDNGRPAMDMACLAGLQQVIPKLRTITFTIPHCKSEAFWGFLCSLYGNPNITRLDIALPLLASTQLSHEVTARLLACIVGDREGGSLENLSLTWGAHRQPDGTVPHFLSNFPPPATTFRTLTLANSVLQGGAITLFLEQLRYRIGLVLDNVTVYSPCLRIPDLTASALDRLSLSLNGPLPTEWHCTLLRSIHQAPRLAALTMDFKMNSTLNDRDVSSILGSLSVLLSKPDPSLRLLLAHFPKRLAIGAFELLLQLPRNPRLQTFMFTGRLTDETNSNRFLVDMLKGGNSSLTGVVYGDKSNLVNFYTTLNRAGRSIAADPLTVLGTLCDILGATMAIPDASPALQHSILFELLKSSPTTWSPPHH